MSPIDEMKIREGVELVVFEGVLPYQAAKRVKIKHLELDYWLKLYDLHGDAIFEEGAEQRFELDLFKLKYPQGSPSVSFLQNIRQNIKGKAPALLLCGVATPIILGVITTIVTLLTETAPSEALLTGLGCMSSSLFSFLILFSMIWVMNMGASVAKTKLRDRTYIKERRLVDKHEISGALQLSSDADGELAGSLALSHEAGALALVGAQDDISSGKFGPPDEVAAALAMGYEIADSDDVRPYGGGWAAAGRMHQGHPAKNEPDEQPQLKADDIDHED